MNSKKEETKEEKLQRIAKKEGGRVVTDPQYGRVVHISPFVCIDEDGTKIYEWP